MPWIPQECQGCLVAAREGDLTRPSVRCSAPGFLRRGAPRTVFGQVAVAVTRMATQGAAARGDLVGVGYAVEATVPQLLRGCHGGGVPCSFVFGAPTARPRRGAGPPTSPACLVVISDGDATVAPFLPAEGGPGSAPPRRAHPGAGARGYARYHRKPDPRAPRAVGGRRGAQRHHGSPRRSLRPPAGSPVGASAFACVSSSLPASPSL